MLIWPPHLFVIGASGVDQLWNGNVGLLVCVLLFPSLPENLCFLEELSPSSRPYSGPAQISSRWERKPHELLRSSIPRSKPGQHIKKRKLHFADKGPYSQSYGFSSSQCTDVRVSLYRRPKNWCFQTVVLEKTLESPLDNKEIKPVNPKGNQSWIFIGRTDDEAETSILWPPDAKNWLIGKDPDAGKDWRQRG